MKRFFIFILILLFSFILFSKIKIDVKTHFNEKFDLRGIKLGLIYFLKQNNYDIVEFGEKYSVWIENYNEKRVGEDIYEIKLVIEITNPSFLKKSEIIVSKEISLEYEYKPKRLDVDETGILTFIKEKIKNIKQKELIKSYYVAKTIGKNVLFLLKGLESNKI